MGEIMNFGNTCALIFRLVLLTLLIYGIVLSIKVMYSCHFMSAVSSNGESHGVGLLSFETKDGRCVEHNSFVVENYNGMELTARVAGYVAPSLGALSALLLSFECFKGGCPGGKCIPALVILFSSVFQGLTFLLFQSDLFCGNTDVISECDVGDAGYLSVQSCLVYAFCMVLYFCGPTPEPFKMGHSVDKNENTTPSKSSTESSTTSKEGENKKKKIKKTEPGKGEDWTREMYEQRRKEKKSKSRGVSGRSKEEIFDDLHDSGRANGKRKSKDSKKRKKDRSVSENTLVLYEENYENRRKKGGSERGENSSRSRSHSRQEKFDDYVDTDPDGMDWSAFTPVQREAYYERQRIKKKERREWERAREIEKLREWEEQLDRHHGGRSRSPIRNESDYSRGSTGYDDDYYGPGTLSRYDDDDGHSYYSTRYEGSEYDVEQQQQYNHLDDERGGEDGVDDRRVYSRSPKDYYSCEDYSYDDNTYDDDTQHESEYSYSQSQDPPMDDGSYYYNQASQRSSRHSRARYYT